MLVRCLYASRARQTLVPAVTDAILEQSRRNNAARGITGLLCFADDIFVQVLEGGRDPVCDLLGVIMRDDRHQGLRLLAYEEIGQRRFGHWNMGQVNLARVNTALLLKYSARPALDPFANPAAATMALLHDLVDTAQIVTRGG
ncbi:MAG: BLUF domain-containing protein [Acetobacteraceae bacterium]|nr:BLUF domain-containing protein [Acetobacteraceae bacterium]